MRPIIFGQATAATNRPIKEVGPTVVFNTAFGGKQSTGIRFRPPAFCMTQETHMIGLWPLAPDHETDFAASPSTAQCRGAAGPHGCCPSLRGGLRGRRLTCPAKPAELSAHNRWRTAASNIRPPDGRRHDRPDASRALRNGIASGPKRGSPATAIPAPGSESLQTPFDPGTAGDRWKCVQRKKSFMPNGMPPCPTSTWTGSIPWHISPVNSRSAACPPEMSF